MTSSHQFAIMSLHVGQKYYREVYANYLSHSAISSIDSGKGSFSKWLVIEIMSNNIIIVLLADFGRSSSRGGN